MEKIVYCDALLEDSRLVEESLKFFENALEPLGEGLANVTVDARAAVGTEVSFAFRDADDQLDQVKIVCSLKVDVKVKDLADTTLISYQSVYGGVFRVIRSMGLVKDEPIPADSIAPYVRQVAFQAIRRAETGLSASGIAMRLNIPNVQLEGLLKLSRDGNG